MKKAIMMDEHREHDGYYEFLSGIRRAFENTKGKPLFMTDAGKGKLELFQSFLNHLPKEAQQHYTCNACRRFVNKYGGLVTITKTGRLESALWDEELIPGFFEEIIENLREIVEKSKIIGVFYSKEKEWGFPITGEWQHMSIIPPNNILHTNPTQSCQQKSAEKREDYKMLLTALKKYPKDAVIQAIKLLKTDSLYRSEKCLGVAKWFYKAHEIYESCPVKARTHLFWEIITKAPPGYCHINATMIGTLLEDIINGWDYPELSKRFAAKMNSLNYQRPKAAPKAGNIKQAEKAMKELNAAGSLERRFALIEEIKSIWRTTVHLKETSNGEVFGHLKPKDTKEIKDMKIPPVRITWVKFRDTVLPDAGEIFYFVPVKRDGYCAYVTAVNVNAPPIIQWDNKDQRNPFSQYVYSGGSRPEKWNLTAQTYCPVNTISLHPHMWYADQIAKLKHHGEGVLFILKDAKDTQYKTGGLGLFPEILRSEFHGVRATIEAFSNAGVIQGHENATACGITLNKSNFNPKLFRVLSLPGNAPIDYKIDRWD